MFCLLLHDQIADVVVNSELWFDVVAHSGSSVGLLLRVWLHFYIFYLTLVYLGLVVAIERQSILEISPRKLKGTSEELI